MSESECGERHKGPYKLLPVLARLYVYKMKSLCFTTISENKGKVKVPPLPTLPAAKVCRKGKEWTTMHGYKEERWRDSLCTCSVKYRYFDPDTELN